MWFTTSANQTNKWRVSYSNNSLYSCWKLANDATAKFPLPIKTKGRHRSYKTHLVAWRSHANSIWLLNLIFALNSWQDSQHMVLATEVKKSVNHWRLTACTASNSDKDPAWSKHVFLRFLNILSIPSIVLNTAVLKGCDAAHYHHLLDNLCFQQASFEQRMISYNLRNNRTVVDKIK